MGGSGLDRTDDFQKFCRPGLDRTQFYRVRTGLGLKNFTVRSSLISSQTQNQGETRPTFYPGKAGRQSPQPAFSKNAQNGKTRQALKRQKGVRATK